MEPGRKLAPSAHHPFTGDQSQQGNDLAPAPSFTFCGETTLNVGYRPEAGSDARRAERQHRRRKQAFNVSLSRAGHGHNGKPLLHFTASAGTK